MNKKTKNLLIALIIITIFSLSGCTTNSQPLTTGEKITIGAIAVAVVGALAIGINHAMKPDISNININPPPPRK